MLAAKWILAVQDGCWLRKAPERAANGRRHVKSYVPAAQDHGHALFWSVEPGLTLFDDRELFGPGCNQSDRKCATEGIVIRPTLVAVGQSICLQGIDNGPGIATADLPHIVKRFAPLETTRNTAGYGLGLNLVSAVAKLHGGRLVLKNNAPGLSATIELPALAPGI
jgi:hypothetical protein